MSCLGDPQTAEDSAIGHDPGAEPARVLWCSPCEAAVCNRCRTTARRSATPVVDEPACQGAQLQTAPDQATTEIPSPASQEVRLQTPPERMRAVGPHQKASQRRNLASIRPPSESKGAFTFRFGLPTVDLVQTVGISAGKKKKKKSVFSCRPLPIGLLLVRHHHFSESSQLIR